MDNLLNIIQCTKEDLIKEYPHYTNELSYLRSDTQLNFLVVNEALIGLDINLNFNREFDDIDFGEKSIFKNSENLYLVISTLDRLIKYQEYCIQQVCSLFEEIFIHEDKINRFLKQISILGTLIKESKKTQLTQNSKEK